MPAMRRWNVMLRIFISEYLHLSVEDVQKRSEWEDDDEEDQSPPPHNELVCPFIASKCSVIDQSLPSRDELHYGIK